MFLGEYSHSIDDKGRLTIPAKLRAGFAGGLVITRGFEPCLILYPQETFRNIKDKVSQHSVTDPSNRQLNRLVFSGADATALDSAGRVLVPEYLRAYAGLQSQIVVVGAGDYLEVWDSQKWADQLVQLNDSEANAQRFASLDLTTGA